MKSYEVIIVFAMIVFTFGCATIYADKQAMAVCQLDGHSHDVCFQVLNR